jgi:hypothetical protein
MLAIARASVLPIAFVLFLFAAHTEGMTWRGTATPIVIAAR